MQTILMLNQIPDRPAFKQIQYSFHSTDWVSANHVFYYLCKLKEITMRWRLLGECRPAVWSIKPICTTKRIQGVLEPCC